MMIDNCIARQISGPILTSPLCFLARVPRLNQKVVLIVDMLGIRVQTELKTGATKELTGARG